MRSVIRRDDRYCGARIQSIRYEYLVRCQTLSALPIPGLVYIDLTVLRSIDTCSRRRKIAVVLSEVKEFGVVVAKRNVLLSTKHGTV